MGPARLTRCQCGTRGGSRREGGRIWRRSRESPKSGSCRNDFGKDLIGVPMMSRVTLFVDVLVQTAPKLADFETV